MPATCPNCGRAVDRSSQFCDSCGAFLGWEEGETADSQLLRQSGPETGDQRAAVQLRLTSDVIQVAPGSAESTTFTVRNQGTQVEEFRFVVTGPEWIAVEPAALSVYPGQEATGAIQAAPPRKPSSLAGITPFRLTATSAVHAGMSSSAAGRVDVAPYHELAAELVPTSGTGRGLTRHRITLDNRGNVPLRIALHPTDVADGLRIGVPAFADVAPGQVTEVPVTVYGTRRWIGRPEPKTFSIIAEAPKPLAATRLSGTRTVLAVFPSWVPLAAAGLVVVAAAGATAATQLLGKHGPAAPNQLITRTTVPATTPGGAASTTPGSTTSTTPGSTTSTTPSSVTSTSPSSVTSTTPNSTTSTSPSSVTSTTPAAGCTVIAQSAQSTLQGTYLFDFDSGTETATGADVFWEQQTSTVRSMNPEAGAAIVNLGAVDFASLSCSDLRSEQYANVPIDGNNDATNQLANGDVFAVRTNQGNYAKVQVISYGYNLELRFVTYKTS
jgi:hypothetical protein